MIRYSIQHYYVFHSRSKDLREEHQIIEHYGFCIREVKNSGLADDGRMMGGRRERDSHYGNGTRERCVYSLSTAAADALTTFLQYIPHV